MKFALLDTVVLNRDVPEHGLRAGDLGAVAELYGAGDQGAGQPSVRGPALRRANRHPLSS